MNRIARAALSAALGGGLALSLAPTSQAATSLRVKAMEVAAAQKGDPYRYGATGPSAFDCSGLVLYSYGRVGKTLPRTAQQQYNAATKTTLSNRTKGDLVFIGKSSGSIYHVGIFAGVKDGYGLMWDAPKPGRTVGLHRIRNYAGGSTGAHAYYARIKG